MRLVMCLAFLCSGSICAAPDRPEKKPESKNEVADKPFVTSVTAKDGILQVTRQMTRLVPQQRTRKVTLGDGTTKDIVETVNVPVTEAIVVAVDPKTVEIQNPDGKAVEAGDIAKAFKDPVETIVSPNGKAVPEELRKRHKDAFIILMKPKK